MGSQAEEGLYLEEGIAFEHIEYIDNQPVLDLLDMQPGIARTASETGSLMGQAAKALKRGIIQMIDEEVRLPKVTDRGTLLIKMNAAYGGDASGRGAHPAYATDYRNALSKESLFTVKHCQLLPPPATRRPSPPIAAHCATSPHNHRPSPPHCRVCCRSPPREPRPNAAPRSSSLLIACHPPLSCRCLH